MTLPLMSTKIPRLRSTVAVSVLHTSRTTQGDGMKQCFDSHEIIAAVSRRGRETAMH